MTQNTTGNRPIGVVQKDKLLSFTLMGMLGSLGQNPIEKLVDSKTQPGDISYFVRENNLALLLLSASFDPAKAGQGVKYIPQIKTAAPEVGIIITSGSGQYRDEAMANGADEYLLTPFGVEELGEVLQNLL